MRESHNQTLVETNALLSTLFETLPVSVLAEDSSRNLLAINDRMIEMFDMPGSPQDVVGADCERLAEEVSELFVNPDEFVDRTNELVADKVPVSDEEWTLRDGRTLVRSHRPIELPSGAGHLWVYQDVTDQVGREHQLEVLNEKMRDLMAANTRESVAEIGVDAARDILDLESNAIHLFDEETGGLVPVAATRAVYDLVDDIPTFSGGESIAWRVYEQGEARAVDDIHADPDVYNPDSAVRSELHLPIDEFGILVAGSPTPAAFDQQDLVLGEILAGNIATALEQVDQTERLREREAELSRQNERLEEFASVVSHDLRNPLNVASGRLGLLAEECDSEHVEHIEQAHTRMGALIDDLLALARQGNRVSDTESVDLDELVRTCWLNVATADATIEANVVRSFDADRSRLQQLLENLFRNAVDHAGEDVTVTVGELPDGFYVEDDGDGIPENEREEVFRTGYSPTEGGTGFGLSIVRQVAEAHGWEITATESSSGGTRFEITGVEFVDA